MLNMKPFTYGIESLSDFEKIDHIRADIISQLPPGLRKEAKVKDLVFIPNNQLYEIHFDDASTNLNKYTKKLRLKLANKSNN